jgi:hypothetical protein
MTLYPPLGNPPLNCAVCGGRVPTEICERHPLPRSDFIALRDKYIPMLLLRSLRSDRAPENGDLK